MRVDTPRAKTLIARLFSDAALPSPSAPLSLSASALSEFGDALANSKSAEKILHAKRQAVQPEASRIARRARV